MAYGAWNERTWKEVYNNTKYAIGICYAYRQDIIANKTEFQLVEQYCRSMTQHHTFDAPNCQYGYQFINYAGKAVDGRKHLTCPIGGYAYTGVKTISIEKTHKDDGTFEMPAMACHWINNQGGQNSVIERDWWNFSLGNVVPKIDREQPNITELSTSEITINSVKIDISTDSNSNLIEYSFDVGTPDDESTWEDSGVTIQTDYGGSTSFKVEGLNPNKEYSIKVRVRRTLNHVFSDSKVVTFETISDPPLAPTNLMATNVTSNTITLEWDLVENAVKYRLFKDQSLYVETPNSSYTVTDLQPNRAYTFAVSAVDEYEQFSPLSDAITIRTLDDVSKILVNVNGVAKTGKVFVNVNGEKKPVKKLFVNVNGEPKEVKNI